MKTVAAQTAKLVRQELKSNFPGVKFTVKSDSYAGGNSVNVSYTDTQFTQEQVETVLAKFQQGNFNSMEDIYEYSNTQDHAQVKYLFVKREMSEEVKAELLAEVNKVWGNGTVLAYNDYAKNAGEWVSTLVYRLFRQWTGVINQQKAA